ncbi:hypothetical protein [Paenisporosarcina cavernae]|uniref:Uncharacterized protein n=1 Tax=Paenisporosarcina cavernae TaxID=2320858 RepID=A0A385YWS4_9BACL|nr:hypothetical protein [Paenisporosarcina cavernae]AYC29993.1 hypothetical protein D3873_08960 [Paenisporosarcina cavernae]
MPIKNNVQVKFGTGDVGAVLAYSEENNWGMIQFEEIEQLPIGDVVANDSPTTSVNDAPVSLVFEKVESIDVVLFQLGRLRDLMAGSNIYEVKKRKYKVKNSKSPSN